MPIQRGHLRKVILSTAVLFAFLSVIRNGLQFVPAFDFCEYWAAGKLVTAGINPYSVYDIFKIEHSLAPTLQSAVMMLNPPWAVPLVIPLSFLSFQTAQIVWMALSLAILVWCSYRVWQQCGSIASPYGPLLISFLFAPTLMCLKLGQITPLILLGIVCFLEYHERRPFIAGAGFALILIKPHLLFLVVLAFLIHSVRNRRWSLLAGFFSCLAVLSLIAVAIHPSIFVDYLRLVFSHYGDFVSSAGGFLREKFGQSHRWLQFAPMLLGFAWYFAYGIRRAFPENLPALAFASIITTSYGWTHDQTVLLFALIPALVLTIAERNYLPSIIFVATDISLVVAYELRVSEHHLIWTAPCWALVYWTSLRVRKPRLREIVA